MQEFVVQKFFFSSIHGEPFVGPFMKTVLDILIVTEMSETCEMQSEAPELFLLRTNGVQQDHAFTAGASSNSWSQYAT